MAMRRFGKEPFPVIYQDSKADSEAAKAGQLLVVLQTVDKPNCSELRCIWQYSGSFGLDVGLKLAFVVAWFPQKVQVQVS